MKWIALRNNGIFELQTALNLIGASVKTTTDPIGMFGSGAKYALAQASRLGMSVKIILGGVVWTMETKTVIFRETEEKVIQFRSGTGKIIKTPITQQFGQKDWNDNWYIFREFYSNMLDERGTMDIVDGIPFCGNDETIVLLQYQPLAKYADNVTEYFKSSQNKIELGTGKVYVQGVYAGQAEFLEKFELNMHFNSRDFGVLNETRSIKEHEVKEMFMNAFQYKHNFEEFNVDIETLVHVIHKRDKFWCNIFAEWNSENWMIAASRIDPKYIFTINEEETKDAEYMGFHPLKFIHGFYAGKSVAQYVNLDENMHNRKPTEEESIKLRECIKKLAFLGSFDGISFKVIRTETKHGSCDIENGVISINERLFQNGNEFKLVDTMIHEYGHYASKAIDGTRTFVDYFTRQLALLAH